MPTSDLPVELWLEILAYLPRTTIHKMIGVNRTLFELALNDMYEEVRFIADDKGMMKTFKQLQHAGIAQRVKHLFIRPAFLPGITENVSFESRSKLHRRVASGVYSFKKLIAGPQTTSEEDPEILPESVYDILDIAGKAVKLCGNLNEITLVLHDHTLIPPFMSFLHSLWGSDSVGPNLRKLTIDTTVVKTPVLLDPLQRYSSVLTNLDEFRLDLAPSRYKHSSKDWCSAGQSLVSFFETFKGTITSLSVSSMVLDNLGELFEMLPRLPKLKRFELLAIINVESLLRPEGLTGFIARHTPTLETFVIKPEARHISFHHSNDVYTFWLNQAVSPSAKKFYSFSDLNFARLRTLEVGLRNFEANRGQKSVDFALLPPLSQIAPTLTKLVLTGAFLLPERLSEILDTAPRHGGKVILEELSFGVWSLIPNLFDLLVKKLPLLKALTIQYEDVLGSPMNRQPTRPRLTFDSAMDGRTYPNWTLRYLRLTGPSSCGEGHPSIGDMRVVARSLSDRVVLDTGYKCYCVR